jgi:hypothetical protein
MQLSSRSMKRRNHLPILDVSGMLCDFCCSKVTRVA